MRREPGEGGEAGLFGLILLCAEALARGCGICAASSFPALQYGSSAPKVTAFDKGRGVPRINVPDSRTRMKLIVPARDRPADENGRLLHELDAHGRTEGKGHLPSGTLLSRRLLDRHLPSACLTLTERDAPLTAASHVPPHPS
jgi:hypothetical protein